MWNAIRNLILGLQIVRVVVYPALYVTGAPHSAWRSGKISLAEELQDCLHCEMKNHQYEIQTISSLLNSQNLFVRLAGHCRSINRSHWLFLNSIELLPQRFRLSTNRPRSPQSPTCQWISACESREHNSLPIKTTHCLLFTWVHSHSVSVTHSQTAKLCTNKSLVALQAQEEVTMTTVQVDQERRNLRPRVVTQAEKAKLQEFVEQIHYSARYRSNFKRLNREVENWRARRYSDDEFDYRHVQLPKNMLKAIPNEYKDQSRGTLKLLWEDEWRGLGITQVREAAVSRSIHD